MREAGPTAGTNNNMMNNFPLRSGKGETFEGGIRGVGLISGAGLSPKVRGTISRDLHHVSDWYKTILDFAAEGSSSPPVLKHRERPFLDGDGVSNYNALALGGKGNRDELFIAAQAEGSRLKAQAIRVGKWKLLKHPQLTYDMPSWYPPPGKAWNYTSTLTVQCPEPPETFDKCDDAWCLFDLEEDPCEHHNVAKAHSRIVSTLQARLAELGKTTVLTWVNYSTKDKKSDPLNFGPTVRISPDPQPNDGPHIYQGVWKPWLTQSEEAETYPTAYSGPGY